ncbi:MULTISPECIES: glycosyltransferase [Rahnella]|uniref:Glycosyltransferase n=1 Tax=Rahnella laticis TaxID=2787622 RepID=A0ABS0E5A0_9GAMM|nr:MULTISPECIES: glycosyltransferase [Rahnella]MBF7980260.1 glycosyltransferase [Rahnella laticis]MBF8000481.1 glycosyltransferase [Rahnella sp. LAC-M12]
MKFEIMPILNIIPSANTDFKWVSENIDPQCKIVGWENLVGKVVRLSFKINIESGKNILCVLYSDTGNGYKEETSLILNADSEGYVSEELQFPHSLQALRLDPISCEASFSFSEIVVDILGDTNCDLKRVIRLSDFKSIDYNDEKGYCFSEKGSRHYCYIEPRKTDKVKNFLTLLEKSVGLLSIIVPTYNTDLILLERLIQSVRNQWYTNWELIFVDDASPSEQTTNYLNALESTSNSIKVKKLISNVGIAGATNEAIRLATGNYVVFLDHDDELTSDCLYELAFEIEKKSPDFIYSDEDKITTNGSYVEPHFKPVWSPDSMMSTMYTCHVMCIKKTILERVGGLRSFYDGCQDWDLVLRISELTTKISHIPKVLYHWRIIPGSTAADVGAKPYILQATQNVRLDAIKRRGLDGSLEPLKNYPGYYRVKYALQNNPLVSIIIPTRDNCIVLERAINSIFNKSSYVNIEVIIVDNGSVEEETLKYLNSLDSNTKVKVVRHNIPFNYSELNNVGVKNSGGDIYIFANDDVEVITSDWIEDLSAYSQLKHVGAVGAKLLYPGNGKIQHAGVVNLERGPCHAFLGQDPESPGYYLRNQLEYNWLAVTGACMAVEASKFKQVGGFDESLPVAYNDIDICIRLYKNGFYNLVCQAVHLYHHESVSRGLDAIDESKLVRLKSDMRHLYSKHADYFQYDPFYSVNLDCDSLNFDLV